MELGFEDIKFVFKVDSLREGDILLMNTYHNRQRGLMGDCIYDHAAIYIGDAFLVEADGFGVMMSHIYSYGFKEEDHACVLRLKDRNNEVAIKISTYMRSLMGMEFGTREARKVPERRNTTEIDKSNRAFCSRSVAQAYRDAGLMIVTNPDYCAPDDFLTSDLLDKVENPTTPATSDYYDALATYVGERKRADYPTFIYEAFKVFSGIYGEDIQTITQLGLAALKHPEKDEEAIAALHNSTKLFKLNDYTHQLWPWFDNDEDFFSHYDTTEKALWFIICQMSHYDKTYLPCIRNTYKDFLIISTLYTQSKMLSEICRGYGEVLSEVTRERQRLEYLYIQVAVTRDSEGFREFSKKHLFYGKYEYKDEPINICEILFEVMKIQEQVSRKAK